MVAIAQKTNRIEKIINAYANAGIFFKGEPESKSKMNTN
jgi:hypothetical protein